MALKEYTIAVEIKGMASQVVKANSIDEAKAIAIQHPENWGVGGYEWLWDVRHIAMHENTEDFAPSTPTLEKDGSTKFETMLNEGWTLSWSGRVLVPTDEETKTSTSTNEIKNEEEEEDSNSYGDDEDEEETTPRHKDGDTAFLISMIDNDAITDYERNILFSLLEKDEPYVNSGSFHLELIEDDEINLYYDWTEEEKAFIADKKKAEPKCHFALFRNDDGYTEGEGKTLVFAYTKGVYVEPIFL